MYQTTQISWDPADGISPREDMNEYVNVIQWLSVEYMRHSMFLQANSLMEIPKGEGHGLNESYMSDKSDQPWLIT